MTTALERDLVQELRMAAKALGVFLAEVGQRKAKGSGTTIGMPDLVLIANGHTELIEVKRPKLGCLSLGQRAFIERASEQGVKVHVVDNLQDFVEVVNGCRRRRK
jgi:hypothetical protein